MNDRRLDDVGGPVVHPTHYNACGEVGDDGSVPFEPIKVIEAWGYAEGFCFGNALKYILRAPHKGSEREDLEKAHWYLCRLIGCSEPSGGRGAPKMCFPSQVSEAWSLPEHLRRSVECIAFGAYGEAAEHVAKHLDVMRHV